MTLLLMEVTPVNTPMTKSILDTLKDHSDALKSFNAVTSLVRSQVYRGSLLQIASVLGVSDDPRVREALQADEEVIADLLHRVSQSDSDREEVLALLDDDAQNFLNVVQDVLDRGFLLGDPAEGLKARRLLVKLSSTCYKLPSKLFIEGVELSDAHATFGGGFGDVFRASYNGQAVALKRMRIFQRDPNLPSIRRRFCQEALTWQSLKHAYIVPFLGIVAEEFPTALCLVSPWMRNGTVLKYLADNGRVNVNKRALVA
ncbi:hypothetical protein EDD85DRAFT_524112 [Armillaria nabsnona]|nr:hypothetical protein EDD85DRAFT_524112 [Armillaria nabsnona]